MPADRRHVRVQHDFLGVAITGGLAIVTGLILVAAQWGAFLTDLGVVVVLCGFVACVVVVVRLGGRHP